MLDLDKYDIPHFHETLKINMSLMIANETVGSYLHRIIKGQNTTNIVFIRHWTFHAYLGFDTLIPAPRFWHLVFSYISRLRHLDLCTKVLTHCFWCISGLQHPDPCTEVLTHCFWCISGLQHPDPYTKVSTSGLSCLS